MPLVPAFDITTIVKPTPTSLLCTVDFWLSVGEERMFMTEQMYDLLHRDMLEIKQHLEGGK